MSDIINEQEKPVSPDAPEPPVENAPPIDAGDDHEHTNAYKVDLDTFSGPLDLLLYLIRKDEVDIYDIPISLITEQYLTYLDAMADLDVNVAGEFIVMAAMLLEIKAKMMAPQLEEDEAEDEDAEDPRMELVRQLMDYRRFKEAAMALSNSANERALRFTRTGERINEKGEVVVGVPKNIDLTMLLEAFSRVLEQTGQRGPLSVEIDEISQERINADLEKTLQDRGRINFYEAFENHKDKVMVVGVFFGVLELAKRQILQITQEELFGDIWLDFVPEDKRESLEAPPSPEQVAGDLQSLEQEPRGGSAPSEDGMMMPDPAAAAIALDNAEEWSTDDLAADLADVEDDGEDELADDLSDADDEDDEGDGDDDDEFDDENDEDEDDDAYDDDEDDEFDDEED
jgi:segregation and condensation protein A